MLLLNGYSERERFAMRHSALLKPRIPGLLLHIGLTIQGLLSTIGRVPYLTQLAKLHQNAAAHIESRRFGVYLTGAVSCMYGQMRGGPHDRTRHTGFRGGDCHSGVLPAATHPIQVCPAISRIRAARNTEPGYLDGCLDGSWSSYLGDTDHKA